MSYKISTIEVFDRQARQLAKHYPRVGLSYCEQRYEFISESCKYFGDYFKFFSRFISLSEMVL